MTGCASLGLGESEYACKGRPNEPTCMSARDVYQATNYKDSIVEYKEEESEDGDDIAFDDEFNDEWEIEEETKAPRSKSDPMVVDARRYIPAKPLPVPRMIGALPVRSKSKIMRIWIAPYEDKAGDLNAPGIVYTEIEGRKWTIGEDLYRGERRFSPLSKEYRDPGY